MIIASRSVVASAMAGLFVYGGTAVLLGVQFHYRRRRRVASVGGYLRFLSDALGIANPRTALGMAAGGLGSLGVAVRVGTGSLALGALSVAVGMWSIIAMIERVNRRRCEARSQAWPDALRQLTARLRGGATIHQSLIELAEEGPEPLRDAFGRYQQLCGVVEHQLALESVRESLADPISDRVIETLLVALDQGSRVVIDILEHLAESVVADLALRADASVAQLETRIEARAAAALPFVVLALLCAGSDDYRRFYASPSGTVTIMVGVAASVVGLSAISRLGRPRPELRLISRVPDVETSS